MELDELKFELRNKLATDHASKSNADIAALMKKKANSVISKLKRSLWIEIVSCVVCLLAMGYVTLVTPYWSLRIYFGVFTVVTVAFMILLLYLLRRTSTLSGTPMPVKSNLETIAHILEEFVRRYFQFIMALIPICITFAFLLSYQDPVRIPELDKVADQLFSARWQVYAFSVGYIIVLVVGVYYFTKWYLKKFYGKYLTQLNSCISELQE